MILGYRHFANSSGNGANIFLLHGWALPIEDVGSRCFHAFDSTMSKFETDEDPTMLYLENSSQSNNITRQLHTASLSGVQALPLSLRSLVSLWTIFATHDSIYFNLPHWIKLSIESNAGDLTELRVSPSHLDWVKTSLESSDHSIRLGIFDYFNGNFSKIQNARFLRVNTLLEAAERHASEGLIINPRRAA